MKGQPINRGCEAECRAMWLALDRMMVVVLVKDV